MHIQVVAVYSVDDRDSTWSLPHATQILYHPPQMAPCADNGFTAQPWRQLCSSMHSIFHYTKHRAVFLICLCITGPSVGLCNCKVLLKATGSTPGPGACQIHFFKDRHIPWKYDGSMSQGPSRSQLRLQVAPLNLCHGQCIQQLRDLEISDLI